MQTTNKPADVTVLDLLQQEQLFDELEQINVDRSSLVLHVTFLFLFQIGEDASSDDEEEKPGIVYRPKIPEKKTRTQRNKEVMPSSMNHS